MSEKWKEREGQREGGTEGGRRGGGTVSSAVCPNTPHPKTPRDSQLASESPKPDFLISAKNEPSA